MRRISYEEYVKLIQNRLNRYPRDIYTWKYHFMKDMMPKKSYYVNALYYRYMQDDITIKWDIKR